jgi:integrase
MQNSGKTWGDIIGIYCSLGKETSIKRKLKEFKMLRWDKMKETPISETTDLDFLELMKAGGTYTQEVLKTLQNYALDQRDLERPVMSKKWWIKRGKKIQRAITLDEHRVLVANIRGINWARYLELLWATGASQSDAAGFRLEFIKNGVLEYRRMKTGSRAALKLTPKALDIVAAATLGRETGFILPSIQRLSNDRRADHFRKWCIRLGVETGETGVTLHSYRYSWARRAYEEGIEQRQAMIAVGHNSSAIHHYYAKGASVVAPSLQS